MAPRRGSLRMPQLKQVLLADLPRDGELAWRRGASHEEQFDYEAAHALYRHAVLVSDDREAEDRLAEYCAFLVERYGQFAEVAQWLDEPQFDPLESRHPQLAKWVITAALEAGHPRAHALDTRLAREVGDLDALEREAKRLVEARRDSEALALLDSRSVPPISAAGKLLETLRSRARQNHDELLAPFAASLERGDLVAAAEALETVAAQLAETVAYRKARAQLTRARDVDALHSLRQRRDAEASQQRWEQALSTAVEVCERRDADKRDQEAMSSIRRAWLVAASEETFAQLRAGSREHGLRAALEFVAQHTLTEPVPEDVTELWSLAVELRSLMFEEEDLGDLAVKLSALDAVISAANVGDFEALATAIDALSEPWRRLQRVLQAQQELARHVHARRRALEAQTLDEVQESLVRRQLGHAGQLLAEAPDGGWLDAARVKSLKRALQEAELHQEREQRALRQLHEELSRGALLSARRTLASLEVSSLADAEHLAELRATLESRSREELVASPAPPFGLKLERGPVASAVWRDRLILVQGRLWLSIGLEDGGVAPFLLPEAHTLVSHPAPQLGCRGDTVRLLACTADHWILVEQLPGQAPEITAGRALSELTSNGEHVVSWAMDPSASQVAVLVAGASGATSLCRFAADTLEPLDSQRFRPPLASATPIKGTDADLFVTASLRARTKGAWALARLDPSYRPSSTWTDREFGEGVAGLREVVEWSEEGRVYASYDQLDPFDPTKTVQQPSLAVWRQGELMFASADLRRRFAPTDKLIVDHPWTLDATSGRLWFAALPRADHELNDALLVSVDAKTLRPRPPVSIEGAERVLALHPLKEGAAALVRTHQGRHMWVRVEASRDISLTLSPLPV